MPTIDVTCRGDGCWTDLAPVQAQGQLIALMGKDAPPLRLALLTAGMVSGRPSVAWRIDLPDGRVVLTATSLLCLENAVSIMQGFLAGMNERGEVEPTSASTE